jgi:hypothetical protein
MKNEVVPVMLYSGKHMIYSGPDPCKVHGEGTI